MTSPGARRPAPGARTPARADRAVERAARATLRWSLRYTDGLDPLVASDRRQEILSDLHEHAAWANETGISSRTAARSIRSRMLRGIPADIGWRRAQLTGRESPARSNLFPIEGLMLAAVALVGVVQIAVGGFVAFRQVRALLIGDIGWVPTSAAFTIALGAIAVAATAVLAHRRWRAWGAPVLALTGFLIFAQSIETLWFLSASALVVINRLTWWEPAAYAVGLGVATLCLAATAQWADGRRSDASATIGEASR
ncbi:hypothetical protein [Agromyces sp. LHK192]|uniref:hypothetical protein n=1 Tax=Agromyces sp. LHK192 TaxID=2498704 RepID=UPI000FDB0FF7|nr:hypothetical protein [Agromyces sp. LHK192]